MFQSCFEINYFQQGLAENLNFNDFEEDLKFCLQTMINQICYYLMQTFYYNYFSGCCYKYY